MGKLEKYSAYKDSGVEWLKEIPEHWEVKKLKFVSHITMGQSPEHNEVNQIQDGMAFLQGNAEFGKIFPIEKNWCSKPKKIASKNDILYSVRAPVGAVNLADKDYCIGRGLCSFREETIDQNYLFYSSILFKKEFDKFITGSTFEAISVLNIKNIKLSFPPKSEQIKIASFLDTKTEQLDKAIKQKEQLIELLKERRQILINDAVTKGIDKTVTMKESGVEWIGNVPTHWEVKKVKNIFNLIIDTAPNNNDEELLSIYTDIGVKPRKELSEKGNKASTTDGYWKVKKGDFIVNKLLAWMGAVGLSNYDGVTSPAYDILRSKIDTIGIYYHELFRLKVFSKEMKKHSRGIMDMRLRLYFDKFGDIRVPYPSQEEQQLIVNYIEENNQKINKSIDLQQQQIEKLKEYKTTLIDSVVTGKVRVY